MGGMLQVWLCPGRVSAQGTGALSNCGQSLKNKSCSEGLLPVDHSLDTVVHILDEVDFGAAESADVGDIVDVVVGLGVLTVGTSDLHVVLISDSLELLLLVAELGKSDVHGGAETSAEVGGA